MVYADKTLSIELPRTRFRTWIRWVLFGGDLVTDSEIVVGVPPFEPPGDCRCALGHEFICNTKPCPRRRGR